MTQFRLLLWLVMSLILTPLTGCSVTFDVSNGYSATAEVSVRDPDSMEETFVISVNAGGGGSAVVRPANTADFDVLVKSGGNLLTNGEQTHLNVDALNEQVNIEILSDGSVTISVDPK